jgi:hypothetical protein
MVLYGIAMMIHYAYRFLSDDLGMIAYAFVLISSEVLLYTSLGWYGPWLTAY